MDEPSAEPTPRRRRWPRRLLIGVLAFIAVFYVAGGWYFSNMILTRALSGEERRASLEPNYNLVVRGIGDGFIVLEDPRNEEPSLRLQGVWGLRWEGGYGQVGAVTEQSGGGRRVVRGFEVLSGDPPSVGQAAELDERAFPDPETAGVYVRDVMVPGPLGEYPAWMTDGNRPLWVIVVHGNSMSRLDNLRLLPALQEAGYPTLTITYRNDEGAPEDPSGFLRYGLTEWKDLEAAVQMALDQGAPGIALMGDSMGGGVIAAFLERSPLASQIRAVVLDAPMLNFSQTVDDNASRETLPVIGLTLPSSLTAVAKWIAGWRFGVAWDDLDYLAGANGFDAPILVFHGTQDLTVPIGTSEDLARRRPDLVTLVRCPGADHIECWNVDHQAYEQRVVQFLEAA